MQQKRTVLLVILAVIVIAGGIWFYDFVLGDTEEASAPISSIPLEITSVPTTAPEEPEPTVVPQEPEPTTEPQPEPTAVPEEPESYPAPPQAEPEPTVEQEAYPAPEAAESPAGLTIFEISQADSEARFTLDEILRGEPTTVVGVTDQVAGQIAVDFTDLSTAQLGIIQVNARTLATDNNFRNRAIRNRILFTDEFEFITFAPTSLNGLPDSIAAGETASFQIVGDLTIQDAMQEVTFEATVTAVSGTELSGTAVTTVLYADFGLVIPEVESVADVDEAVVLEIEFVARAIE